MTFQISKKRFIPGFKYRLEILENDDLDYKILKDSLGLDFETDNVTSTVLKKVWI